MEDLGNPYRAGAGHSPPYLAGREAEIATFRERLRQQDITTNVILTGLRGVGKTVLMDDKFKPLAQSENWAWVGSDFSETSFTNEVNLCTRLITDLSVYTSSVGVRGASEGLGFNLPESEERRLDFKFLMTFFDAQPGLMVDKLKAVLQLACAAANKSGVKGIVFAYDESQEVCDKEERDQYPLALLLESFQSIQRKGARCLLLLTGLPTLYPRLVESRTYAERMFSVQEIGRLSKEDSERAITVPLEGKLWQFAPQGVEMIVKVSDGYPYFIQFICRDAFDFMRANPGGTTIPIEPIVRRLDSDFFSARWDLLSDRQRDLLFCISRIGTATGAPITDIVDAEFTIPEIVSESQVLKDGGDFKAFAYGDVSQMLPRLIDKGLVYKNRHGKYLFAVPLFGRFIARKYKLPDTTQRPLFE
jgi:AAA ATPase domain